MPTETAWKARFARLWNTSDEKTEGTDRAHAHQRVLVALEAWRQVAALPGWPGAAALSRVAGVHADTASRVLASLKAAGA
jgi:hypothetical protein